jgi:hypothetical protein
MIRTLRISIGLGSIMHRPQEIHQVAITVALSNSAVEGSVVDE